LPSRFTQSDQELVETLPLDLGPGGEDHRLEIDADIAGNAAIGFINLDQALAGHPVGIIEQGFDLPGERIASKLKYPRRHLCHLASPCWLLLSTAVQTLYSLHPRCRALCPRPRRRHACAGAGLRPTSSC